MKTERDSYRSYSDKYQTYSTASDFYIVYYNAKTTQVVAENATGVPNIGDAHPDDSTRYVTHKHAQLQDDSSPLQHWAVQVDYTSQYTTFDPNPLSRPAQVTWDYSNAEEAYAVDYATEYGVTKAQAVTNTAGEPLGATRESGTWSATWTKNVAASFTIASEINTMQCVNSDTFTFDGATIAQHSAKISGGSLSPVQMENGYQFRTVTYKLKFKTGGWIDKLANVGLQEMSSGKRVPIVSGTPPAKIEAPWPLDSDGVSYADPTVTPDLLTFYPYHTMAFTPLFS